MSQETTIVGNNLDLAGNVKVALTTDPDYVGSIRMFSENDAGDVLGTAVLVSPETSQDYRLRVGMDTVMFTDSFGATIQNTNNWQYVFNTLTAIQPGAGTVNFSAVQGTTAAHGAYLRSFQHFPLIGTAPLAVEFTTGIFTSQLVSNEVWLMGLGIPGAAATPATDGVWLKATSAGWTGVIAFNGNITESGILWPSGSIILDDLQKWVLTIGEQTVEFWRNDILIGVLAIPVANGQPFIQSSLPVFLHKYNTGVVANNNTMRVSDVTVSLMDIASNKTWAHQMAGASMAGYVTQNGTTNAQTSSWVNNTPPNPIALSNTAWTFTALGGLPATLPTLTANNDGIICSYLNPAASTNITGRTLIVTGIKVQGTVTTTLTGGPVLYAYAVAFGAFAGGTPGSLASVDTGSFITGTTHAPRRMFLGMESYANNAIAGTTGLGAQLKLSVPIVVRPGEYIQILARNMGTVTTAGAITFGVVFDSYWE